MVVFKLKTRNSLPPDSAPIDANPHIKVAQHSAPLAMQAQRSGSCPHLKYSARQEDLEAERLFTKTLSGLTRDSNLLLCRHDEVGTGNRAQWSLMRIFFFFIKALVHALLTIITVNNLFQARLCICILPSSY